MVFIVKVNWWGIVNWYNYLEKFLIVFIKFEYMYFVWFSNFVRGYIFNGNVYLFFLKDMYKIVYSSIIYNSLN